MLPLQQKAEPDLPLREHPQMVQQMPMAEDVDIRDDLFSQLEALIGGLAQLLLWVSSHYL